MDLFSSISTELSIFVISQLSLYFPPSSEGNDLRNKTAASGRKKTAEKGWKKTTEKGWKKTADREEKKKEKMFQKSAPGNIHT